MKKLIVSICAALLAAFCFAPATFAFADELPENQYETEVEDETQDDVQEEEPPVIPAEPENGEETGDSALGIEALAERFITYLKEKYGADYEYYYDQIIEQWGSVEAYLLQFGQEHLTEEQQTAWNKFVSWLSTYSPVWAPVLAVAVVIAVAIFGKKKFDELLKKAVDSKVNPIVNELNKQSSALAALMEGTKALLPKTDKFTENAELLEKAEKELTNG